MAKPLVGSPNPRYQLCKVSPQVTRFTDAMEDDYRFVASSPCESTLTEVRWFTIEVISSGICHGVAKEDQFPWAKVNCVVVT